MLIKACLNGSRYPGEHPALPLTPEQLAHDARLVVAAGARALHIHLRSWFSYEAAFNPLYHPLFITSH